ncbi:MAG: CBS domain-containing protein [Desulfosarcina sp.]|nr:CBS domain-containing protein [Desulfobacterales bacterium]
MVPLSEYATVSEGDTLYEAVIALEKAQEEFDPARYRHRAILIMDAGGQVVGKISQTDILRALEPKYEKMLERENLAHSGLTRGFMKSLMSHYDLWGGAMLDICKKAAGQRVKDFMRAPADGEFIDATATLDEAIHQLVVGGDQSLLVHRGGAIVGILRLTDVFAAVFEAIKACAL